MYDVSAVDLDSNYFESNCVGVGTSFPWLEFLHCLPNEGMCVTDVLIRANPW